MRILITARTFRRALGAPFYPSPPSTIGMMLTQAGVSSESIVYDLGCGDGDIVVAAVRDHGAKKAIGIERDRRLCSRALRKTHGFKNAVIVNADYDSVDISEATVVTLYQSASENARLKRKLVAELRAGTTIVTHDFGIPGWRPRKLSTLKEGRRVHRVMVYLVGSDTPTPTA